jgi:hypothetical protein
MLGSFYASTGEARIRQDVARATWKVAGAAMAALLVVCAALWLVIRLSSA